MRDTDAGRPIGTLTIALLISVGAGLVRSILGDPLDKAITIAIAPVAIGLLIFVCLSVAKYCQYSRFAVRLVRELPESPSGVIVRLAYAALDVGDELRLLRAIFTSAGWTMASEDIPARYARGSGRGIEFQFTDATLGNEITSAFRRAGVIYVAGNVANTGQELRVGVLSQLATWFK